MEVSTGVREGPPHNEAAEGPEPQAKRGRKPYEKPAFQFERVFETNALSCGKVNSTQGQCRFNRKTS
jgi:hypothetical protein